MESQRSAPILITLFAALSVLYPLTRAAPARENKSAPSTDRSRGNPESQEEKPASPAFPSAKDLVSEFLFSRDGNQAASSGHQQKAAYSIDFLIATVPDPVDSRLPHFFDCFIESLESASEAAGYTLDRFASPWPEKGNGARDGDPSWHRTLFESVPGLILFRDPQNQKLLVVFLVGETPTTGIHKQAMFSALDQMAQFYPWDPKHTELPPGFPVTKSSDSIDTLRVMGPSFSGSAVSMRFVLDRWSESRGNIPNVRFQIISGTATAINVSWLSQAAQGHATFQAAVPPDDETLQAVACYIDLLGYQKIAILTEGNTAYGQNFTKQMAPGKGTDGRIQGGCGNGQSVPEILSLPFPMHISRLRAASQQGNIPTGTGRARNREQ